MAASDGRVRMSREIAADLAVVVIIWMAALLLVTRWSTAASPPVTPVADAAFVRMAADDNLAEIQLGNLAQLRAASGAVMRFGLKMSVDHQTANDELKRIAQRKHIPLPTAMDATHLAMKAKLEPLQGDAFDRAYMDVMLNDHRRALAAYRAEASSGTDRDLKAYAAGSLLTLQEHLDLAEATNTLIQARGE